MSKADEIADAIEARLQNIKRSNGFSTNAGLQVFQGRTALDPERLPCLVMFEPEDTVGTTRGKDGSLPAGVWSQNTQPFHIECFTRCDPDRPNKDARAMIADVKRAIFGDDLTLGGLVTRIGYVGRAIDSVTHGTDIVSALVKIEVVFNENVANP